VTRTDVRRSGALPPASSEARSVWLVENPGAYGSSGSRSNGGPRCNQRAFPPRRLGRASRARLAGNRHLGSGCGLAGGGRWSPIVSALSKLTDPIAAPAWRALDAQKAKRRLRSSGGSHWHDVTQGGRSGSSRRAGSLRPSQFPRTQEIAGLWRLFEEGPGSSRDGGSSRPPCGWGSPTSEVLPSAVSRRKLDPVGWDYWPRVRRQNEAAAVTSSRALLRRRQ
jgi:hypothetical protein